MSEQSNPNEIVDDELLKYLLAPIRTEPGVHDQPCAICGVGPADFLNASKTRAKNGWSPVRHRLERFGIPGLTGIACDACYGRIRYRLNKAKRRAAP